MNVEHLVTMANQIGAFFDSQGTREDAVAGIANHLKRFWEPRMLHAISAHVDSGSTQGMMATVVEAVRQLAAAPAAAPAVAAASEKRNDAGSGARR